VGGGVGGGGGAGRVGREREREKERKRDERRMFVCARVPVYVWADDKGNYTSSSTMSS
jgi:hypothetical protein